jgi:hypothetical protein
MVKAGRKERANTGRFRPGNRGRPRGAVNKATRIFKEAVLGTFHELGGQAWLTAWARVNPTQFVQVAARLIPPEVSGTVEARIIQPVDEFHGAGD